MVGLVVFAEREVFDPPLRVPSREALLKIVREASRGLIALLACLCDQLHDDRGDDVGHILYPFGRWYSPPSDVAMQPLHGVGRGKRQGAREHPVKRDAECVQVAAGIDRPIHAAGLLWRHIGEGAGDCLEWFECLPLARKARCDAEPRESDLLAYGVHQDICRFKVLVNEAAPEGLRGGAGHGDSQAQKAPQPHWRAEQPVEWLAGGIFKYQHGLTALADQRQGSHGPSPVQFILQRVLMSESVEAGGCRMLCSERHDQNVIELLVSVRVPFTAEDAFAVLPQYFKTINPGEDWRGGVHLSDSGSWSAS